MTSAVAYELQAGEGIAYEVMHALPGRVRVRIDAIKYVQGLAENLSHALKAQQGILSVSFNCWCGSLVIDFDSQSVEIHTVLAGLSYDDLPPFKPQLPARTTNISADSLLGRLLSFIEEIAPVTVQLVLGSAAFAAAMLQLPGMVTKGLLWAAVIPISGRAVRTLVEEKRFGVDSLDGLAAILMIAQRNWISAGFMTALIGLGEYIRDRTAQRCKRMITDLLGLKGRSAWIVRGKKRIFVPADQVQVGDLVVVYTGEMVPVDGIVTGGTADVDQAGLTGESIPVEVGIDSQVYAATIVVEGKIYVRCTAAGNQTRAGLVIDMVNSAPLHETKIENYAASLADKLVLPILLGAGLCFAITGNITRALSMLIFDFATGIRIAAPTAILASMQRAARRGILIKSGGALERLATVDAILFDKTGTLTTGEPHVTEVISLHELPAGEIVALAAAVEQRLHHPAARAIVHYAKQLQVNIPDRAESTHIRGMGVRAVVGAYDVMVGSQRMLETAGINTATGSIAHVAVAARGESLAYVALDGKLAGIIAYKDQLRPEVARIISGLRKRGVKEIVMATGDIEATANAVARTVGIDHVLFGAFPEQKAELVKQLKAKGMVVAVIGDGINDSPALAHADVAISLHGGTDAARETADVVLTDDDLRRLPETFDIARGAMGLIQQTIGMVVVPNGIGLVLAAGGLIGPALATLLNNGCAIICAVNSLSPLYADFFASAQTVNGELPKESAVVA